MWLWRVRIQTEDFTDGALIESYAIYITLSCIKILSCQNFLSCDGMISSNNIYLWSYLSCDKSWRSDDLWRFACSDVFDNFFVQVYVGPRLPGVQRSIHHWRVQGFCQWNTLLDGKLAGHQFSESFWDKISDNNYPNFPNHFGPDLQSHYSESIHQNWPKCSFQKCLLKKMWAEQSSKSWIFCRKSVWWHFLEWSILYDFGLLGAGEIF